MKWERQKPGVKASWVHEKFLFHDPVSTDDMAPLGNHWVREVRYAEPPTYDAFIDGMLVATYPTLKEAKAHIVAHLVAQRLEDTS